MFTSALLLSVSFFHASVPSALPQSADASVFSSPGGPPSIRIADKAKGDITRAQWAKTSVVKLAGCVPDARVVSMKLCINDCKGKQAALTATDGTFTQAMKEMIDHLPNGKSFTVKVEVKDGGGKSWEVPDASYVLID